jgi:hypothetical protein
VNIGKHNYWFARVLSQGNRFVQPMNFIMLIYLTAQQEPLAWLLLPTGILFAGFWVWLDKKGVNSEEWTEWFDRNPRMVGMQNDLMEIKELLKE